MSWLMATRARAWNPCACCRSWFVSSSTRVRNAFFADARALSAMRTVSSEATMAVANMMANVTR